MYQITESAFMVGLVSVFQFLGPLVLSVWAGALSDRVDRRKVLIVGRLISITANLVLAALIGFWGLERFGGPIVLVAGVLVLGVGMAVSVPAMQAMVPSLVEKDQLEPAIALSSLTPSIGRMIGPVLGAGLLVLGGPALGFAVAAAVHLFFVAVLLTIRQLRPQERPKAKPKLLGGLRYLLDDRKTGALVLAVALLSVGGDSVLTLTPAKADTLGGGGDYVGILASSFGAGAVLFLVVLGLHRTRSYWTADREERAWCSCRYPTTRPAISGRSRDGQRTARSMWCCGCCGASLWRTCPGRWGWKRIALRRGGTAFWSRASRV